MPTENRSSNTEQMVSVPRSLLEEACNGLRITQDRARKELRALLAQPAAQHQQAPLGWVYDGGQEFTSDPDQAHDLRAEGIELTAVYGQAQHQGEPVAYIRQKDIDRLLSAHVAGCSANLEKEPRDGFVPFFAHPDSGEVERLRRALKGAVTLNTEGAERERGILIERDTLRAQLARLRKRAWAVMQEALDGARVHPCDEHSEEVKARTLLPEWQSLYRSLSVSADPSAPVERDDLTSMVDAAMVEMAGIHPPLKRSECERLIRAALERKP